MKNDFAAERPILVAIPDEWRDEICQHLEQHGYSTLAASSREDALALIHSRRVRGIVMISDWAMTSDDGKAVGLMEVVKGRIPTVCLITRTTWQWLRRSENPRNWFEELYQPPLHEYCSVPVALEELLGRFKVTGIDTDQAS